MKFVFFADSHLARRTWADRPIEGDSYWALAQIMNYAIHNRVEGVFGAGDLIDKAINRSEPIVEFFRELGRLSAAGIPFFYNQGQHEMSDVPWLSGMPTTYHLHGHSTHELLGHRAGWPNVYGIDYQPADKLQEALAAVPDGVDVLMMHQVWGDLMGDIASPQGSMSDVPKVSCVFSGDYHVSTVIETHGKDGQPLRLISPGSTCMQSINEPPDKYFYILDWPANQWTRMKLENRALLQVLITHPGDIDAFASTWPSMRANFLKPSVIQLAKPLLWVTCTPGVVDLKARIMQIVGDSAFVFWSEKQDAQQQATAALAATQTIERGASTLSAALHEFLEAEHLVPVEPDCRRLLDAADVGEELARMRAEALA